MSSERRYARYLVRVWHFAADLRDVDNLLCTEPWGISERARSSASGMRWRRYSSRQRRRDSGCRFFKIEDRPRLGARLSKVEIGRFAAPTCSLLSRPRKTPPASARIATWWLPSPAVCPTHSGTAMRSYHSGGLNDGNTPHASHDRVPAEGDRYYEVSVAGCWENKLLG